MKKLLNVIPLCIIVALMSVAGNSPDDDSGRQSKSFTVQKGGLLTVEVAPGAVILESWQKDEVMVEAIGTDERHPELLSVSQSGNNISVKYREKRHSDGDIKFRIKVPSSFNAEIRTSGGSIKQKNVLGGYLKAETMGGSVDIDEVTGTVDVETRGGSIEGNRIGGNARLKTGGGSIEIKKALADLTLKTGGGSIEIGEANGKTEASTGGGSIEVGDARGPLSLETGGGAIKVKKGTAGASVKTGGGSIELNGIRGYISAKTGGGSIAAELIPDATGKSTIKTGGGEISLSVPAGSKATIDAKINTRGSWGHGDRKPRIRSDFKADLMEGEDGNGDVHAVYTLNGGGQEIQLETSASDIEIKKGVE
jgi:hypothetical protein